ncbi:MAG: hypothetical protein V4678_01170 [Patescibacteria group bacterium]
MPSSVGICSDCHTSYTRAWCVGNREGVLRNILNAYKFERVVDMAMAAASLLDEVLPSLPPDTTIVPVPTVASHIRQRGYDHTLLIARALGKKREIPVELLLSHIGSSVQRGKSKKERFQQAEQAYECRSSASPDATYLLIDDVVTTNATLRSCAAELRRAGAQSVWVAVLARQALDK